MLTTQANPLNEKIKHGYFSSRNISTPVCLRSLPKSTATTGWEFVNDIKRVFREEPKRANMRTFCKSRFGKDAPACGMVGCAAGFGRILAGRFDVSEYESVGVMVHLLGQDLDYNTVGASKPPYGPEFDPGNRYDVFNDGRGDDCATTTPGTRAHARAIIRRLNKFMKVIEKMLKARKLKMVDGVLEPVEVGELLEVE